ncbi:hypothetical protein BDP67DRAFT_562698 [Colletotrichum lupini]|nr:hypothetical protein BDP67DRAFT_562698 [Colletotrichum lupini]
MKVGMGGSNDFAKSQTDSGVIHFLSGMDTEDQKEWRYVTFNGSEISTVWPAKAGTLRTWSHVVSGHRPHLCLEFTSPALIKVVKSINTKKKYAKHQSVLSFLSAEVLVLTKNFEELTVLDESPVFPVWPSPPRVEQLGVGRGRAQLKIRIKHVLHQHG